MKDANKKTREILDHLETKVGITLKNAALPKVEDGDVPSDHKKIKVLIKNSDPLDSINLCNFSGCRKVNPAIAIRKNQYSTPGGKKIYTFPTHSYSLPTSPPLMFTLSYPIINPLIFQVPVHRRNPCLLQFLLISSSNLQLFKIILVQKSVRFCKSVKMPVLILFVYDYQLLIVI